MSYGYNQNRKRERMTARVKNMTIAEYKNLRPYEVKSHKKIVDFIKSNNIALKLS
jgi:predicted glycosyltransferase involved in capsule biosynthesis